MRDSLANGRVTTTTPAQTQTPPPQDGNRTGNGTGSLNRQRTWGRAGSRAPAPQCRTDRELSTGP